MIVRVGGWWRCSLLLNYLTVDLVAVTSQHPAYNVTAEAARTTVRLSWMPAYDAGFPLHYVVW